MEHEREPIPLYVLNRFLNFEKKIYRFNDIPFTRPVYLKTVLYFLASLVFFLVLVFLPGPGTIIRMMPPVFILLFVIGGPLLVAHLLAGIGMENRPPINAFMAVIRFHLMTLKKESYYKGKIIKNPEPIYYVNTSTVRIADKPKKTRGQKNDEKADKLSSETHRKKLNNEPGRDSLGLLRH